jgi:hypothetical protein
MKKPKKKPAKRVVDMAKGPNLKAGPKPEGKKKKKMM